MMVCVVFPNDRTGREKQPVAVVPAVDLHISRPCDDRPHDIQRERRLIDPAGQQALHLRGDDLLVRLHPAIITALRSESIRNDVIQQR